MILKFGAPESVKSVSCVWHLWNELYVLIGRCEQGIVCVGFGEKEDTSIVKSFQKQFKNALFSVVSAPGDSYEELPFYMTGTPFQNNVWKNLFDIAPGQIQTYSALATKCRVPKAVRAVASAVGKNPLAYLLPCHRILRKDGGLGGFRWTNAIKEQLLNFEQKVYHDNSATTQTEAAKLFLRSLC